MTEELETITLTGNQRAACAVTVPENQRIVVKGHLTVPDTLTIKGAVTIEGRVTIGGEPESNESESERFMRATGVPLRHVTAENDLHPFKRLLLQVMREVLSEQPECKQLGRRTYECLRKHLRRFDPDSSIIAGVSHSSIELVGLEGNRILSRKRLGEYVARLKSML